MMSMTKINIAKLDARHHVMVGTEAGISVNLGRPQGQALKSTLNFLGRIPCFSLIVIDL
jgi:hypothetical protein